MARRNTFPEAPGVYEIVNTLTGARYVGSSTNLYSRRGNHLGTLRRGVSSNRKLQEAWCEYGESCFIFVVLEECAPQDVKLREQFWLEERREKFSVYNLCPQTDSNLGYRVPDELKEKLREEKPWVLKIRSDNITEVNQRPEIRAMRSASMLILARKPEAIAAAKARLAIVNQDPVLKDKLRARLREMNRSPEHIKKVRDAAEKRRKLNHG